MFSANQLGILALIIDNVATAFYHKGNMETDRSSMKLYFTVTGILSFCLVCYTKPEVDFSGNKTEDARGITGKMNFTKR